MRKTSLIIIFAIIIILLLFFAIYVYPEYVENNNNNNNNNDLLFYNNINDFSDFVVGPPFQGVGQTFTANTNCIIATVNVKLYRYGNPDIINLYVFPTTNGLPVVTPSNILGFGTEDPNILTTSNTGQWVEIVLSSPVTLSSGVKYAVVISAYGTDSSNFIAWKHGNDNYNGGSVVITYDSFTWYPYTDCDFMFEIYGQITT